MNNDALEKLLRKIVREENEPLKQGQAETNTRLSNLEDGQAHLNTAVEAVAAGQHDVQGHVKTLSGKVATKADVQDIKVELVKHQRRIENVEENPKTTKNPHENY